MLPAVRLAADPQRRHARRQPRHRLADRRRPPALLALEAVARPGLADGGPRGPAGGLLHRIPAQRPARRRADPGGADPAAAGRAHRLPQDRQAPVRRHLQRRRRLRARRRGRRRYAGRGSVWAASPRRRSGPGRPRRRSRAGRGPRRRSRQAAEVMRRRGHADGRPPGQRGLPRGDARPGLLKLYAENPSPQECSTE